ncbi:MAG: tRNA (adenosine(37)-N6)-dimethylallyltransferase MiaA [Deltaproteobacteria bacterium]|nr:tRNA (adenosine(37)-N6)-dimethylallyltransferase MiaA [Deltaproteobacteria bacterium]
MDKIVIIQGPTATGKSALAVELAKEFNGEIISADSMQVYRSMDIGTAKPSKKDRDEVPHHLIDIVDPKEEYTAADYMRDGLLKIRDIRSRGKNVFVTGGTGLYIKALTMGLFPGPKGDKEFRELLKKEALEKGGLYLYNRLKEVDPESASRIHPNNIVRVIRALEVYEAAKRPISELQKEHAASGALFDALKIGLFIERALLYERIGKRVDLMIAEGLLNEVKGLLEAGYSPGLKPMLGLGYKEMIGFLEGRYSFSESIELLKKNTRHYAKRQMTWFKKDDGIRWFKPEEKKDIIGLVSEFLS